VTMAKLCLVACLGTTLIAMISANCCDEHDENKDSKFCMLYTTLHHEDQALVREFLGENCDKDPKDLLKELTKRKPNFLRFGRSVDSYDADDVTNFYRVGKTAAATPQFLRFGRAADPASPTFLRFGKNSEPKFLRFGKRKPNFLRFGRNAPEEEHEEETPTVESDPASLDRETRKPNFLRFGKRKPNFLRFGKRKPNFLRFGKRKPNFLRFGKRGAEEESH
jgi:hypothetical protein